MSTSCRLAFTLILNISTYLSGALHFNIIEYLCFE